MKPNFSNGVNPAWFSRMNAAKTTSSVAVIPLSVGPSMARSLLTADSEPDG
jgi:hypothetical protein